MTLDETLGLSALAGTGRAQQNDSHDLQFAQKLLHVTGGHQGHNGQRRLHRASSNSRTALSRCAPARTACRYRRNRAVEESRPTKPRRNAFYAQSGGVSAVINASACGVIETALSTRHIGKVYAGRHGIIGALTEDLIDCQRGEPGDHPRPAPHAGRRFGSARFKLKGLEQNRAEYERLIEVFRAHDIGYFFYNGGNDSMDTALKVSQIGESLGYPITCIGVPKTVDNDLPHHRLLPGLRLGRQIHRGLHARSGARRRLDGAHLHQGVRARSDGPACRLDRRGRRPGRPRRG